MGRFDPEWQAWKKGWAADRRAAEREQARNRAFQRRERGTFLAAERQRRERTLKGLSDQLGASTNPEERRQLAREWNRVQAEPLPGRGRPFITDTGVTDLLGGARHTAWGRHQQTTEAFARAERNREAKSRREEARFKARRKQKRFSTNPAPTFGYGGGRRQGRGPAYTADTQARRNTRERFKDQIAANDAAMGRRARTARERRLLAEAQAKAARRGGPATVITKLAGRDRLVETRSPKGFSRALRDAAAKGQKVSLMPTFSRALRGKKSDGVVGQSDEQVRIFGNGQSAVRVIQAIEDDYGGDVNAYCQAMARKTGVLGAFGLRSISMNTWDPHETNSDEFEDEPIYVEDEDEDD